MADRTYRIDNYTALSPADQARARHLPDFLERPVPPGSRVDDLYERTLVASGADGPAGRITAYPRRLLPYRDPDTGGARLTAAALVEFPVTAHADPHLWDALFAAALAGLSTVGVYLPPEYRRHVDHLGGLGFKRFADDYDSTRSLYLRSGPDPAGPGDLYPISAGTNLMRTANAASALLPETGPWSAVDNYSGFSGYPWLTPLLDDLLGTPRRLLTMPAGTGDVIRLLPERILRHLDSCVGVDILDRNVAFARDRAARPHLDTLNMLICAAFLEAKASADAGPVLDLLAAIAAAAGRPLTAGAVRAAYTELRAVTDEALTCGGIADWFALTKGVGRLLGGTGRLAPCGYLADAVGADAVRALAARDPRVPSPDPFAALADRGAVSFVTADMFGYRSTQPFDTIFVWEAMLIVAAAAREREYVTMIDANLAPGGTAVLTGIRRDDGNPGRDLEIVAAEFRRCGYPTVVTAAAPAVDRWARGCLPQPVFPVLIAQKSA